MEGVAPHMEIMGAGEWVRWEDYDRARADALGEMFTAVNRIPTREEKLGGQTFKYVKISEVNDTILALALAPTPPAEPAQVTVQEETDLDEALEVIDEVYDSGLASRARRELKALRAIAGGKP